MSAPSFAPGSPARILFDLARSHAKSQPGYSPMEWNRLQRNLEAVAGPLNEYHTDKYISNRCGVCGVPWESHQEESPECVGIIPSNALPAPKLPS